ncbi:MAG: serine hydrolase [Clostridiales Family XIII bacterium]|nr:beta-lactamase family protein [Clostridia bacterium]MDY3011282.1 serine hydrolase [Clostridiales Family XIII bacterium]
MKEAKELEAVIRRDYDNMAGIVVLKDGKLLYEQYFHGCTDSSRIHVYSVTKSIVSILIGIAIDKGYIRNVQQKVLEFFPDYTVKRRETTIQHITLEHLLTMTVPYKYRSAPYTNFFSSDDWVKAALDLLGGKGQIGQFRYAPLIGPDIMTGILVKATGQSVLDFAAENLFTPLGIAAPPNVVFDSKEEQLAFNRAKCVNGWVADPKGVNTAGWGLTLSPMEMAKIGQLCLNGGTWQGKQIVSPKWIETSTKEHSRWEEQGLPYGYLWWVDEDGYAAMGDGGNVIFIHTKKKMVAAITSFFKPKVKDRIEFIKAYISAAE